MENKKMKIGLNVFDRDIKAENSKYRLVTDGGKNIDFAVCHFDPDKNTVEDSCKKAKEIADEFAKDGIEFIANFEFQNFSPESVGPDGYEWANREDGTHLLNLPEEYITALSSSGNLTGIMYDEFEHVIGNGNLSIALSSKFRKKMPTFPLADTKNALVQGDLLSAQLNEYVEGIKEKGAPAVYGEHVFPILFHKFAEAGITPNFKSQKESFTDIQFAAAAGAALEYGTELSTCVDSWFRTKNPGHSPEEFYNNLLFAYYAGLNRVYAESVTPMVNEGEITEYGKKFIDFCREYKGKERNYDISDYAPEIGIIRYDNSYWGQWDPVMWKHRLFGNSKVKPDYRAEEYMYVLNLLTHGESVRTSLSWDKIALSSLKKHRSFASFNSMAIFDEKVRKEALSSLKLCFLCGEYISQETMGDVEDLVKEGLVCVVPKRLLSDEKQAEITEFYCEMEDGDGKWIIIDFYDNKNLKKAVAPYLGNKNEIRLTFTTGEVKMKISPDGNKIEII